MQDIMVGIPAISVEKDEVVMNLATAKSDVVVLHSACTQKDAELFELGKEIDRNKGEISFLRRRMQHLIESCDAEKSCDPSNRK